jgi:hypothetical protein
VDTKEAKIAARVQATAEERKRRAAEISGSVKKVEKKKAAEAPDELLSVNLEEAAAAETADQPEIADAAAETTEETPQE